MAPCARRLRARGFPKRLSDHPFPSQQSMKDRSRYHCADSARGARYTCRFCTESVVSAASNVEHYREAAISYPSRIAALIFLASMQSPITRVFFAIPFRESTASLSGLDPRANISDSVRYNYPGDHCWKFYVNSYLTS